ncbi:RagB/SusD family nutrient uptake outer membrane protein [Pedobacter sp. PACM 27299]|uniref:RagB/SusD family nutrient uptake outer membrane protein n=1 Tax=Pedobacter sp. PACM 27299 TaxID=1727164 RepID=UPI000B0546C6|nr:RagB/SusD family nutrient uptake outer membrane protein [Pedobacter sp. PACM 27299]
MMLTPGCTKDFLEKPKGGVATVDTVFHTKNQAQYAVAQMYNRCITAYAPSNSSGSRPESITDQLYIIHGINDTWAGTAINTSTYITGNMSPSGNADWGGFGSHYKGIRQANLVLKNIDMVVDADDNWKKDVKAQAIFCRALQHFELFRYYGGIPILDHALGEENLLLPRNSVERVVNTIVQWCDEAAAVLPLSRSAVDYGKATRLAALALKSRVLLYAASPLYNTPEYMRTEVIGARFGDARDSVLAYPSYSKERWKRAADAALEVINNAPAAGVELLNTGKPLTTGETYATLGDYESVWNVAGNKELILVNPRSLLEMDWWTQWMFSKLLNLSWGIKQNVPIEFMQLYEKRDGTKWKLPAKGDNLPEDIKALNLDPRFYQTIAYDGMWYSARSGFLDYYKAGDGFLEGRISGTDNIPNGYALETYKFVPRVDNMSINHFTWPVFRLAEFQLNYAEAISEYEGPNSKAFEAVNVLRSRAGMPNNHESNPELFRAFIQNERTIELAYENHRYNDLLRWLKANEVLNQTLHGIVTTAKKGNNGTLLRSWEQGVFIPRVFPKRYYYLPFSNTEVSKNYLGGVGTGWAGQNPGW